MLRQTEGMKATDLLDRFDASRTLSLTVRQVSRLVREEQIPHIVFPNGEVRFDEDDLRAWTLSHKREGRADG